MRKSFIASVFLAICPLVLAQQPLNNEAVIKLSKAGLSDDLIVSTVSAKTGTYDTSTDGLIALKAAGVSDKVVAAIVAKDTSARPSSPADVNPVPDASSAAPVHRAQAPAPAITGTQATASASSLASDHKQYRGQIQPGARIVIAPMGGFETYFAAAIREKGVPITLTLDRDSAQYFVVSTETEWRGFIAGSSANADWSPVGGHFGSASGASSTRGLESSIMLIDAKSKDVMWAYEVHKSSHGALIFGTLGARGQQSLAEACAKHLKEYMEKGK
jgi:hypothetical protein